MRQDDEDTTHTQHLIHKSERDHSKGRRWMIMQSTKLKTITEALSMHGGPCSRNQALACAPLPSCSLLPCSWPGRPSLPPWLLLPTFMKQKQEQQGHWNRSFMPGCAPCRSSQLRSGLISAVSPFFKHSCSRAVLDRSPKHPSAGSCSRWVTRNASAALPRPLKCGQPDKCSVMSS